MKQLQLLIYLIHNKFHKNYQIQLPWIPCYKWTCNQWVQLKKLMSIKQEMLIQFVMIVIEAKSLSGKSKEKKTQDLSKENCQKLTPKHPYLILLKSLIKIILITFLWEGWIIILSNFSTTLLCLALPSK